MRETYTEQLPGEHARRARNMLGLTLRQVARALHYEEDTLYRMEAGKRTMAAEYVLFLVEEHKKRGNRYPALGQAALKAHLRGRSFNVVFGSVPEFRRNQYDGGRAA